MNTRVTESSLSHKLLEVGQVFLRLGTTSFGGPVAHLAYFREELVERRAWLDEQEYADTLALFTKGDVDGAWVPEPWATRLVQEAGGRVYLDEKSLWPNGDFVTTHLIVRPKYLNEHPSVIENLLRAHVEVTEYANAIPAEAKSLLNRSIEKATTAALPVKVLDDTVTEGRELISVTLRHADGGAVVGSPSSGIVAIEPNKR